MVDFHKATEKLRQNIAERKQRESDEADGLALYRMAGELLGPELVKLSEHGKLTFWQSMRGLTQDRIRAIEYTPEQRQIISDVETGKLKPADIPKALEKQGRKIRTTIDHSNNMDYAIAIVEQICELSDSGDIPSAGESFSEDVACKARDIGLTIETKQYATAGQISALENMHAALARWID